MDIPTVVYCVLLQKVQIRFGAVNLSEKVNEVVPSLCLSCSGHA